MGGGDEVVREQEVLGWLERIVWVIFWDKFSQVLPVWRAIWLYLFHPRCVFGERAELRFPHSLYRSCFCTKDKVGCVRVCSFLLPPSLPAMAVIDRGEGIERSTSSPLLLDDVPQWLMELVVLVGCCTRGRMGAMDFINQDSWLQEEKKNSRVFPVQMWWGLCRIMQGARVWTCCCGCLQPRRAGA